MPKVEHPLHALNEYLPDNSFEQVADYLQLYKVHLTLTKQRQSVLGDYRNAVHGKNHRISINSNLNKFSFLITLLHELAHLIAFEKFSNRIQAHGKEWKSVYKNLLADFVSKKIFPADIEHVLYQSMQNPAASSCAEEGLMRVLRKYDNKKEGIVLIEDLSANSLFKIDDERVFQKGDRLRKRFRCTEKKTGLVYLFNPVYEVKIVK